MVTADLNLNKLFDSLKDQVLNRNDKNVAIWTKYKSDLEVTKYLLSSIPQKVSHKVMVPLGPKAMVPGRIVHTNEFLVNLGETWFVKRSASQATEICERRVKNCDEMLRKLEKERELILNRSKLPVEKEAFGNEERPEIVEYVTEEEDEAWRKQHRLNEKKYRQQLAELKNKEKKPIETEEDLWRHLDELELQEELEDELNRLNANDSSQDESENEPEIPKDDDNFALKDQSSKNNARNCSRRVSFASDFSDDEPLRLEIKHTDWEPEPSAVDSTAINSPILEHDGFAKNPPLFHLFVAEKPEEDNQCTKGELVAYALYYNKYSTWKGKAMVLEDLYCTPQYRKKHIGQALFKAVVREAVTTGCQQMDFEVLGWNPARKFYEKLGAIDITEKESWHLYRMTIDALEAL